MAEQLAAEEFCQRCIDDIVLLQTGRNQAADVSLREEIRGRSQNHHHRPRSPPHRRQTWQLQFEAIAYAASSQL